VRCFEHDPTWAIQAPNPPRTELKYTHADLDMCCDYGSFKIFWANF